MQDASVTPLLEGKTLCVVAVGKAAPFMAVEFARHCGSRIREGVVIGTHLPIELPPPFRWVPSSHPLPDERSVRAGNDALSVAGLTRSDETLVVLLSGGASALMAVPADGLTLEDKRATVNVLLKGGADITALNTVRKHLSAVKGGRLAAKAPGPTVCLAISDVVGDDLSVIGSGPTVPDPSTFADAWNYIEQLGVRAQLPPAVVSHLKSGVDGTVEETPKPGDPRFAHSVTRVIGGRMNAMEGAREAARELGYEVVTIQDPIVGEARVVAPALLDRARALSAGRQGPLCVIASGETTVKVTGKGRGGRNQEMALAAAIALSERVPGTFSGSGAISESVAFASIGTDGIDGPTDAAGAHADETTVARARQHSLDPAAFLADNNAYAFFQGLGDLVITGPTTTNVGDVQIVLFR
jgi:glycerate 2-kinase